MEDKNKGEDLYAELKKTLESVDESEAVDTSVATDQKPQEKQDAPKEDIKEDEKADLTEEEISKLHPKAQKRIKELAEKVKELSAEKPPEKPADESPEEKDKDSQKFNTVQDFLNAVEDEPSRNLLEKFYGVIKGEISTTLSPIEKANNEAKFNEEFAKYEKIDGLADYKNDLKKTFMRNPNQSLKALVGEIVTDISLNKIKPIESKPSAPNRSAKVDLEGRSKDELYDMLESLRD